MQIPPFPTFITVSTAKQKMNLKRVNLVLFLPIFTETRAYSLIQRQRHTHNLLTLDAKKKRSNNNSSGGRGFGKSSNVEKTYVFETDNSFDEIDQEVAMGEFFNTYNDWHPLFKSIAHAPNVPASSHLDLSVDSYDLIFDDESPWEKLPQVPQGPEKDSQLEIVARVLDSFQKALTDIPVNEALYSKEDDENDLQFLEEGRRMLVLNRFQVMTSTIDHESLFRTCWSEIHSLVSEKGDSTNSDMGNGSLVMLGEFDEASGLDLNHFVNTKIRMPLSWLGLKDSFEVSSFERGGHECIRLIHGLGDIPSLEDRNREEEGFQ